MDTFVGSWKLMKEKNEGITPEFSAALGVSAEKHAQYEKMQFTIIIAKADGGKYTYAYSIEGLPEPIVQGPFTVGEKFEFYDSWEKRTEENVFTVEGGKATEKTVIKENPSINWVLTRSIQDGTMIAETTSGGHTCKQYFSKV